MCQSGQKNFLIRKAAKEDVRSILELIKGIAEYEHMFDQVAVTEKDLLQYGFGDRSYFETLLCELEDKKIVGFALYFFTYSTFTGKPTLYLEDLFVKPEYRGQGMGKVLLLALAKIAREKNCGRMEWSVLDWNEPAIEFYKSLGAVAMDEWTVYRLTDDVIAKLTEEYSL